ncbi:MAG: 1,4-dihydroxy-6-naphthoate synthase [Bacteroidetes bacterium]|nr:MAG: 1,4-dihydroxy-6-naphthoate synthase [Bacteroidota bacterium]
MRTLRDLDFAFSPCPNDTYIFGALVEGLMGDNWRIARPTLLDIEELNRAANKGLYDVVKVSVAAYPLFADQYDILPCGGALGFGVGPLVVRAKNAPQTPPEGASILIPGEQTTANLLLSTFYPQVGERRVKLFSEIMPAIAAGECEYGVIIHEGRFTYRSHGLELVSDLGELWTEQYGLPIPLGVICVHRDMEQGLKGMVADGIRKSLAYAHAHPEGVAGYIAKNAQELSEEVQLEHIRLYVNDFSMDLGELGWEAIRRLVANRQ